MRLIIFLLRSSGQMVVIATLTGLMSGACSAALIALINRAVSAGNQSFGAMLLPFAGLVAIALIANFISQILLIRLAQQAIFQLRLNLSRQILSSELIHLEKLGSPRILATLTDDIQAVADAVRLIPFICIDLAIAVGCLMYVTWLSWQVALFILGILVFCLLFYRWILRKAKFQLALAREEQDRLFENFRAVTDGTKELKLHYQRRQSFLRDSLQTTAAAYRRYNIEGLSLFAIIGNWGKLMFFFCMGVVLFALPKLMTLSPQAFSGYILTFTYLVGPMEGLVSRLPVLSRSSVALSKIEALNLTLGDRPELSAIPEPLHRHWSELRLEGVTHSYGSDREDTSFTLGPIHLTLHPGELIFIVGGNGSGKSTLAKLITGLYFPETGKIFFDGQLITPENREWYRQHFSAIFTDFYLFDRLLGLETPDLEQQAQRYLRELHLEHKVRIEQGEFSTTALSQGQRKRLALLIAYLEDRPLYLFDEWAADQDPGFKEVFYDKLLPELRDQGKTILVISHDDRYFAIADRIIKLEYGKLLYDKTQH